MKTLRGRAAGWIVGSAVAVLLLAPAPRAGSDPALTTADLVRFLQAGISEHTILAELQSRGFAGPLDEKGEAALRAAGASETLVVAVRRAAAGPGPTPPPSPPPSGAARPSESAGPGAPTFPVGARTVRVPVSVLDKAGQPVLGLAREDFRVEDDGKRQALTLFSHERRPLRIALALDTSRSMENKIREVEEALAHFIDLLEPADEILVLTFNDHVQVVQDFTSDRDRLRRVLDELEPSGGTALYDAVFEAIQRVAAAPVESKAVVLVTDGVDTSSTVSFADLRETARRAEVPVFSIGLDVDTPQHRDYGHRPGGGHHGGWPGGGWPGGGGGGWPGGGGGWGGGGGHGGGPGGGGRTGARHHPLGFDAKPLMDLADDTGASAQIVKGLGHYTPGSDEPSESGELKAAAESIAIILRHRYLLGYEPPSATREWRTIKVEVDRSDCTARARKGYYAGD
jgi:VWFA-related protein